MEVEPSSLDGAGAAFALLEGEGGAGAGGAEGGQHANNVSSSAVGTAEPCGVRSDPWSTGAGDPWSAGGAGTSRKRAKSRSREGPDVPDRSDVASGSSTAACPGPGAQAAASPGAASGADSFEIGTPPDGMSSGMFSHFLGTVKEQLTSDISKTVAETLDTKFTAFGKICEKQFIEQKRDIVQLKGSVEDMDGRLGTLEQETAANSESVEGMQDKVRALEKQMGEMRCHLNLAQRTERVEPVVPDTSWSRAPDGSLIRLSANGLVARAEMQKLLEVIVEASGKNIKDEHGDLFTCITNAPLARTHLYRSRGTDGIAATTVAHVLGSLRMANGRWKEHAVMGVDGSRLQAYIGNDRTEKQNAEARLGKLYMAELKTHFPDCNLSFQKRTNEVLDEWVVITRVTMPIKGTPALDANPDVLDGKYSETLLRRCFKAATTEAGGSASSVRWQSVV